jgi:hypothetical protein
VRSIRTGRIAGDWPGSQSPHHRFAAAGLQTVFPGQLVPFFEGVVAFFFDELGRVFLGLFQPGFHAREQFVHLVLFARRGAEGADVLDLPFDVRNKDRLRRFFGLLFAGRLLFAQVVFLGEALEFAFDLLFRRRADFVGLRDEFRFRDFGGIGFAFVVAAAAAGAEQDDHQYRGHQQCENSLAQLASSCE